MDGDKYREILKKKKNLLEIAKKKSFTFQQDNKPKYSAKQQQNQAVVRTQKY